MKSVLISIQPYWVFLIIAKKMGWNINQEKTVEIRKNYPKSNDWNKVVKIYCSKDKKSFAKIPKEYQPLMERFLSKVIGEFVCDKTDRIAHCGTCNNDIKLNIVDKNFYCKALDYEYLNKCKLSYSEIEEYSNRGDVFAWHISNLVIYDKPRELSEFYVSVKDHWETYDPRNYINGTWQKPLKRLPQSWCSVKELGG